MKETLNNLLNKVLDVLTPIATKSYFVYILTGLLFVAILCLALHFKKNHIIGNAYQTAINKSILRKKDLRKSIVKKNESNFDRKFRENLTYSGLMSKHKMLTPENWLLFLIILFFGGFVIGLILSKKIVTGLIAGAALAGAAYLYETLLCFRNYKRVDKSITEFLNLLGNFSSQNTEVTDVFEKIYLKVDEPLQSALKECITEAESIGTDRALTNLANKIEHPKFKEIIQNIRISIKHSSSFKSVVENNNQSLLDFIRVKKETEQLAIGNFVQLLISAFLGAFIIYFCGQTLNISFFEYIKGNSIAQLEAALAAWAIIYAGWQVYTVNRS